jgi:hypothetical protein
MNLVRDKLHYQVKYFSALESINIKPNAEVTVLRERKTSSKVLKQEKRGMEMKIRSSIGGIKESDVQAGRWEKQGLVGFFFPSAFPPPPVR